MVPVADGTRLLKKAQRLFNVERDIGRGFKPTNATATALKTAVGETRVDSKDVLDALREITGRDYLREAENAVLASKFVGGRTQGSRRVNLGAIVGMGLGGGMGSLLGMPGTTMGTIAGGMGGAYLDTQGGSIAGSIIDKLARIPMEQAERVAVSPMFRRVLAASGYAY